ncbi:MAG: fatty acid desaturase, partial [bacterium]|nr:fatty acid desaturase [bacterium]
VTEDDPVICHPLIGRELFKKLGKILLIPGYLQFSFLFRTQGHEFSCPSADPGKTSWRFFAYGWGFWIGTLLVLSLIWGWHMVYYVFPAVFFGTTVVMALQEIRVGLEHGGDIGHQKNPDLRSRTTLSPISYLVAPWNANYHFEHHLNAEIPWYRLGQYHRVLSQMVSEKARPLVYSRHAWQTLRSN